MGCAMLQMRRKAENVSLLGFKGVSVPVRKGILYAGGGW